MPGPLPEIRALSATADTNAFRSALSDLLEAHAIAEGHPFDDRDLRFEIRDGERFLGGASGTVEFGWLLVKYLVVAPEYRGRGLGRALMLRLEAAAQAEGATQAFVDTYGFQAEGLYLRLGYEVFARLETPDPATTRIMLRKRLGGAP